MKVSFFKISKSVNESIKVEYDIRPHFYDVIHYHPEIQLTLIIESTGSAYFGEQILNFNPGDIFLAGGNLPHIFKNDPEYFLDNNTKVLDCGAGDGAVSFPLAKYNNCFVVL